MNLLPSLSVGHFFRRFDGSHGVVVVVVGHKNPGEDRIRSHMWRPPGDSSSLPNQKPETRSSWHAPKVNSTARERERECICGHEDEVIFGFKFVVTFQFLFGGWGGKKIWAWTSLKKPGEKRDILCHSGNICGHFVPDSVAWCLTYLLFSSKSTICLLYWRIIAYWCVFIMIYILEINLWVKIITPKYFRENLID